MTTILVSLVLVLGAAAVLAFNVLVRRRNAVENAFAGIVEDLNLNTRIWSKA